MQSILTNVPLPVLQQAVMGGVPDIKPFVALAELNKRNESAALLQAMMGQKAMQAPTPPTIAQQVIAKGGGIANVGVPQRYSGGGIVSFAGGGKTSQVPEWDYSAIDELDSRIVESDEDYIAQQQGRDEEIRKREEMRAPLIAARRAEILRQQQEAEAQRQQAIERRKAMMQRAQFDPMGGDSLAAMAQAAAGQRTLGGALAGMAGALSKNKQAVMQRQMELEEQGAAEENKFQQVAAAKRELELALAEKEYAAKIGDQDALAAANEKIMAARQKLLVTQRNAAKDRMEGQYKAQQDATNNKRIAAQEHRAQSMHNAQMDQLKWAQTISKRQGVLEQFRKDRAFQIMQHTNPAKANELLTQRVKELFGDVPPEYLPPEYAAIVRGQSNAPAQSAPAGSKTARDYSNFSAVQVSN